MNSDADGVDTGQLVRRAQAGDTMAQQELLTRHRNRLKKMIAVFLDPRLSPRVDASDILQETLARAAMRLPDYSPGHAGGFYAWLRQMARDRIIDEHRRHIGAEKRSIKREQQPRYLSPASTAFLADQLVSQDTSPSVRARNSERRQEMIAALDRLPDAQREVMLMRYVEHLSITDISYVLSLSKAAVKSRLWRGLEKMQQILGTRLEDHQ